MISGIFYYSGIQYNLTQHILLTILNSYDLVPEYRVLNSDVRQYFKMVGAMPFVGPFDVDETWRLLKPLLPSEMDSFTDYFERTWIGTATTPPLFSHHIWNQHEACMSRIPRSTNIAEGWHNGFMSLMQCHNPTLWKFSDCIKKEQSLTDAKIVKYKMKDDSEPRADKWVKLDTKLHKFIECYDDIERIDFLSRVGIGNMMN